MKYILLIVFCTLSFAASAQFWQRKEKGERLPQLTEVKAYSFPLFTAKINIPVQDIRNIQLVNDVIDIASVEDMILKEAKHNMRFRIYDMASYNFSDLAALYVQENRFSEAKWYLLQSNNISRQKDDTRHILSNLLALAGIKMQIGEIALAKTDLQEAHDIATAKGLPADLALIDKEMEYLLSGKIASVKTLRYAEAVEMANSKTRIN
jgi:hypothetical protein